MSEMGSGVFGMGSGMSGVPGMGSGMSGVSGDGVWDIWEWGLGCLGMLRHTQLCDIHWRIEVKALPDAGAHVKPGKLESTSVLGWMSSCCSREWFPKWCHFTHGGLLHFHQLITLTQVT